MSSPPRQPPRGADGATPLQLSTLIQAVTRVITLWPEHSGQVALIVKWRFEDETQVHEWYGIISEWKTDEDTQETSLEVEFSHDIAASDGSGYRIRPLVPTHHLTFPYPHLSCAEHVTLPPTPEAEQHVVYYRVVVVIDDRADQGFTNAAAEVPCYYFLQKDGFMEGKQGKVTLTESLPSAPASASQSEVDVDAFGTDDVIEALRNATNSRFNSLGEQLKSLQATVRELVFKNASGNSAQMDEIERNVSARFAAVTQDVNDVGRTIGAIHDRLYSHDRRLERLEERETVANSEALESLRTRCAKLEQQLARNGTGPRPAAPRRFSDAAQAAPESLVQFDPLVVASYPVQRTHMHDMTFRMVVHGMPNHKNIGRQVCDEIYKIWDQRFTAVSSVIATGGDPSRISEEYDDKLQRWATCLKAVVEHSVKADSLETLLYAIDITARHTADGPADQDVYTLVAEAEAQRQLRGPKEKAKKPAPKNDDKGKDKNKDKDKDKAAADKGGSSGNGTGGR